MKTKIRALSPWAQDQRRIRRLRAKVRAQYDRAERWMKANASGWAMAHDLMAFVRSGVPPSGQQVAAWEKFIEENEPF